MEKNNFFNEELVDNSDYINVDRLFAERGLDFNIHSDNSNISNNLDDVDEFEYSFII